MTKPKMGERLDFVRWAKSRGGLYLHDKKKPTLAEFQPYQERILGHCFPGGDEPLPYSRVIWSEPKKTGKTELAAGLHVWFAFFVETPGEQYALANDFDGAKSRVWRYIRGSLERNPGYRMGEDWWTNGDEILFANGSTIRAIASDYRGDAGANLSFATVDEPWGIIRESSVRLMTEFSPVPTRPSSCVFYTGYQGFEGESTWWHSLIDGARAEPVPGLEDLDDGDGGPMCWRAGRTFLLWNHKARQRWHTAAYLAEQKRVLPPSEYLRVWENRRVENVDNFCPAARWEALYDPELRALYEGDERRVVLAVDAATKADSTALVGTTLDESGRVDVVWSQIWAATKKQPIALTETVGPAIIELHRRFRVVEVRFDPYQMAAVAEMCKKQGVKMVEFPQNAKRVQADTHLHTLIWGSNLRHYGDPQLTAHVTQAAGRWTERGVRIEKEAKSLKVDGAVALSMSALGAVESLGHRRDNVLEVADNPFYL